MNLSKGLLAILGFTLSLSTVSFAEKAQAETQTEPHFFTDQGEAYDVTSDELNQIMRWRGPNPNPDRPPRYDDGRHRGDWDRDHDRGHWGRQHVCYAQNYRGHWFEGRGSSRASAARRALRSCQTRSLHCELIRCY